MKKLLTILLMALSVSAFSQTSPKFHFVIENDLTQFGINLPKGCLVYDLEKTELYVLTDPATSTATLSTATAQRFPSISGTPSGNYAVLWDDDHNISESSLIYDDGIDLTLSSNTKISFSVGSPIKNLEYNGNAFYPIYTGADLGSGTYPFDEIYADIADIYNEYFVLTDDKGGYQLTKHSIGDVLSTNIEDLTDGYGITNFTYNGSSAQTVKVDTSEVVTPNALMDSINNNASTTYWEEDESGNIQPTVDENIVLGDGVSSRYIMWDTLIPRRSYMMMQEDFLQMEAEDKMILLAGDRSPLLGSYWVADSGFFSTNNNPLGVASFPWMEFYSDNIEDNGTNVTISGGEVFLPNIDNADQDYFQMYDLSTGEETYFAKSSLLGDFQIDNDTTDWDATLSDLADTAAAIRADFPVGGSSDSSSTSYTLDSLLSNTDLLIKPTGGDVTIDGTLTTDDAVDLDGIAEDVTPDRNLVQNSDGQVKYSEVSYMSWSDNHASSFTLPQSTWIKMPLTDGTYADYITAKNITMTDDSTATVSVDGIFRITFTVTLNIGSDIDVLRLQPRVNGSGYGGACITMVEVESGRKELVFVDLTVELSSGDEITLYVYQANVLSVSVSIPVTTMNIVKIY